MSETIGEILPFAVVVAMSPVPIIAVILVLFSSHARVNSLAFLAGWVVGIAGAMTILIAVASTQTLGSDGSTSTTTAWIETVLGVLLIAAARRRWRGRPAPGEETPMPAWMATTDDLGPGKAAGLGLLLSAVNPKNLLLIAAASVAVAAAGLTAADEAFAVVVFTLVAAATIAIPTLGMLLFGARFQPTLDRAKGWLVTHGAAVMVGVFVLIGVALLGKGLGALL